MVDAAGPSSQASRTPGPWPSWLPWTRRARPAARPASRIVRASSPSKACAECGSQKTSMLSASAVGPSATTASSIGPVTRSTYAARCVAYSRGTTCAPRKVVCGVSSRAMRRTAQLVVEGQAVAALDLDRRRALGAHLGDAARPRGRAARRRSRRGSPRPRRRCRPRRRACRSSARRTPPSGHRRRRGGCASRRSRG